MRPNVQPIKTKRRFRQKASEFKPKLPRCGGKVSYKTHRKAETTRLWNLDQFRVPYLRVYRCKRCNHYHLTSQPERK